MWLQRQRQHAASLRDHWSQFTILLAISALVASSCVMVSSRPASEPGASEAVPPPASFATATQYTTTPTPGAIRGGPLAADLAKSVRGHFAALNLREDGRMAELAIRCAVETQRLRRGPSPTALDAMARDVGLIGPTPIVAVIPRNNGEWERLDERLSLMSPSNIRFTHFGVAVMNFDGAIAGAVAVSTQHLTLDPLPRRVEVNERVRLNATVEPGYDKGEVVWTRPDGSTQRIPSSGGSSVEFHTPPMERGIHQLEILAVGPSGLEVLANVPIACGVELTPPKELAPVDESDPRAALLQLINRERQRLRAPLLQQDGSLDRVAEAHSRDMVEADFVGHQSQTTGVIDDRLRAAGLRFGLFGENVAKGPSAAEAHALLLASPGHRDNIINPRFTHVGIGVVIERASDPPIYAVTEVFAGFPDPIADAEAMAKSVLERLNQKRAEASQRPIVRVVVLDAAAREIAQAVAKDPAAHPPDIAKSIIQRKLSGTRYRRPFVLVAFPLNPPESAEDTQLHGDKFRFVGVAVVQAPSSTAPMTNIVVLVLSD